MSVVQSELSPTDRKTRERQQKVNADGQRCKNMLQEQQRRVTNSKTEMTKRRKDHEAARMKYLRYRERSDKSLQEEDKLRVTSSD